MVLIITSLYSCKEKPQIPEYEFSQPSSILALRKVKIKEDLKFGKTAISAVVTSDIENGNISDKTLILQDKVSDAAIVAELDGSFDDILLWDEVELNLENAQLKEEAGELIVTGLNRSSFIVKSQEVKLAPKTVNIATAIKNAKYWGPILVKLEKVNIKSFESGRLSGDLVLDDEIIEVKSRVLTSSSFSNEEAPDYVEAYVGLLRTIDEEIFINPRNLDDLQLGVLQLVEDFEQASNTNYDKKVMTFITGDWIIDGGITAASAADPKNGKQSIRLQGNINNPNRNGIIEMVFDVKGVKTISVSHGIYPAAAEVANENPTVFSLEISKDKGQSYEVVGEVEIDTQSRTLSTSTFEINGSFGEAMRFRIVNTSLPFANNNRPRINIDDIVFDF